jgi:hypothetical protein
VRNLAQQRFFAPKHKAKRRESSTNPAIRTNLVQTNGPSGPFKKIFKKAKKKLVTP